MTKNELLNLMDSIETVFVSTLIGDRDIYFKVDIDEFVVLINGLDEDVEINAKTYDALPQILYLN